MRVRLRSLVAVAGLVTASLASVVGGSHGAGAATSQTYLAPASGSWTVLGHGNGHGHGLSQYGAYGRAVAGQSMAQIVGFYYPGATLQTGQPAFGATPVRILLTAAGAYPTIASAVGLKAGGVALNPAGASEFRLVPSAAGLGVQSLALPSAALPTPTWQPVAGAQALPATAAFSSVSGAPLTVVRGDGSRGLYRGAITGVRSGSAVTTVNTLGLDDYIRGVAPNESPSSWPAAALQAQVVAARTYALFEVRANAGAGSYDLCDTSNCQVYGGASSEQASTNAAVNATAGDVLLYKGAPVFAQFSSSNGGWTADGGKPYLTAAPDPFDNASTDPWFSWTRTVPVARVAAYYGLSSVTDLRVLSRSGGGDWGGEVTSVAIDGVRGATKATVTDNGYGIRSAMGLPLQWFTIANGAAPGSTGASAPTVVPAAPTALMLFPVDGAVTVTWAGAPAASAVTRYVVTVAGFARRAVPGTTHSMTFTGMTNGRSYRVQVQAVNAAGLGPAAALLAVPTAAPAGAPAIPARVSQWSANKAADLYWAAPATPGVLGYSVTVMGKARYRLPAGASHLTIKSLPNGTGLTVYVRAIDAAGEGPAVVVGVRATPVPAAPRGVSLKIAAGAVTVGLAAPAHATPAVTGFSVTLLGVRRQLVRAGIRATVLTGLQTGTRYKVYVRSVGTLGEGPAYMTSFIAK